MPYIAHKKESGKEQLLKDHLIQTAAMARQFGDAFSCGAWAYEEGLYHDVGKYGELFQRYIRGEYKGRVDHSTAGLQLMAQQKRYAEALCIGGHHSGLPDFGNAGSSEGDGTFGGRMRKKMPDCNAYQKELPSPSPIKPPAMFSEMDPIRQMLFIRMLFSCLVDADFLDTEAFMSEQTIQRGMFHSLQELAGCFFEKLQEKGYMTPNNPLNERRAEILKTCIQKADAVKGIYIMTVPTGGGKTISSLSFAMAHACHHHMRRIIYVIPYTSIIEQTADVFRSFLPEQDVIEHHSQADYDDSSEAMDPKRLAAENWDAPIIVTTNVQFFESLFANRSSRCRKLHNIADSVIVFDEAQMIPAEFLRPIMKYIGSLVKDYGCTALLCSATQPQLHRFFESDHMICREIIEDIPELYRFFKRVTFQMDGCKTYDDIAQAMQRQNQSLCIAATKKEAEEIYQRLGEDAFYLSTNLYPVHRGRVIRKMKRRLAAGSPCHVVSTSVISVGVDIDFPEVYLEMSGLDSLIQGAGRCNREGKRSAAESRVHIFCTEKSEEGSFLRQERQIMQIVSQLHADISSPEAIAEYFQRLHSARGVNEKEKDLEQQAQKLLFASMAKTVKIIRDPAKPVLIPREPEAKEIADQLRLGIRNRNLMRRAGRYMVSVRSGSAGAPFEKMIQHGSILCFPGDSEMAELIDLDLYDEKQGLLSNIEEGKGIMW